MFNNNKKLKITPLLMAASLITASLSIAIAGEDDAVELKNQDQQAAQVKPVEKQADNLHSDANPKDAKDQALDKDQEKEEHAEGKCGG